MLAHFILTHLIQSPHLATVAPLILIGILLLFFLFLLCALSEGFSGFHSFGFFQLESLLTPGLEWGCLLSMGINFVSGSHGPS